MPYSYHCANYPGMGPCPGVFTAETAAEVLKHVELHAAIVHQESPEQWSPDDRRIVTELIRAA